MASTGYATSPTTVTEDELMFQIAQTRNVIRHHTAIGGGITADEHEHQVEARQRLVRLIGQATDTSDAGATLPLSRVRIRGNEWREALQATDSATHTVDEYRAAQSVAQSARLRLVAALNVAYLETGVAMDMLADLAGTTSQMAWNLLDA